MKEKNVLVLTLSPLDNDNRILKEIQTIRNLGLVVTAISVNTNKIFDFENKSFKLESKRLFGIPGLNKLRVIIKYFKQIPQKKNFDIIHCHDLDAFVLGCLYKIFYNKNASLIYDAHEYETERNNMSFSQKKIAKFLESYFIKQADKVICVSDAIAEEYVKLYDIEKPALILNAPLYQIIEKKDIFRDTFKISKEKIIFLYQGGLSLGRGIEILLDTFKTINNNDIVIVFMGYGNLESLVQNAAKEYENIFFHKAVSPEVLLDYTSSADFGILFYENSCLNHYYCSPNKMFEYLMAELPVIVSNLYEMKKVVEKNKIGIVAQENTPKGLKEAVHVAVKLDKQDLQKNIKTVKEVYNWEEQEKVLKQIYFDLLNN